MPDPKSPLNNFNIETPDAEIIAALEWRCSQDNNLPSNLRGVEANYLIQILQTKQQKRFLDGQNGFNDKQIQTNKNLVWATWAMVVVTVAGYFIGNAVILSLKELKTEKMESNIYRLPNGVCIAPGGSSSTPSSIDFGICSSDYKDFDPFWRIYRKGSTTTVEVPF